MNPEGESLDVNKIYTIAQRPIDSAGNIRNQLYPALKGMGGISDVMRTLVKTAITAEEKTPRVPALLLDEKDKKNSEAVAKAERIRQEQIASERDRIRLALGGFLLGFIYKRPIDTRGLFPKSVDAYTLGQEVAKLTHGDMPKGSDVATELEFNLELYAQVIDALPSQLVKNLITEFIPAGEKQAELLEKYVPEPKNEKVLNSTPLITTRPEKVVELV